LSGGSIAVQVDAVRHRLMITTNIIAGQGVFGEASRFDDE
jgi:hypothetical protein